MKDKILPLLFILLPFAFISHGFLGTGQRFFFVLSATILVGILCNNKWLSLFISYIVVWQLYLFLVSTYSFSPSKQHMYGFPQVVFILSAVCVYVTVLKNKLTNEWFYNVICIAAILQACLAICQYCGFMPVYDLLAGKTETVTELSKTAVIGTLGNNGFLAIFLVISMPFFFRKYWCWFIPIILFLLIVSVTKTAIVALLIGCCVYFYNKRHLIRNCMIGILLVLIMAAGYIRQEILLRGVANLHSSLFLSISLRFEYWTEVINQLDTSSKIIFGLGPGASWGKSFPMHNDWLTIFHKFGLIGVSLVAGFVATLNRGNRRLFSAFVIGCVCMLGNYPLHLAPSAFLIIMIVGLMERERIKERVKQ